LHAITVGNTFDPGVMRGIAASGGGSTRTIGGEQTPQMVASELLRELAQPGLCDVNIEFRGLKVAAIYPERLPNVPAGTQQIMVGRYLPEGKDQQGEVIVTGRRGGEQVRFVAKVELKDAEEGNSFIPRLWARGHLESLGWTESAPETVDAGPIAFVRNGDAIRLDMESRTLDLLVDESELTGRRAGWQPPPPRYRTGVLAKYVKLVGSAAQGAVCS